MLFNLMRQPIPIDSATTVLRTRTCVEPPTGSAASSSLLERGWQWLTEAAPLSKPAEGSAVKLDTVKQDFVAGLADIDNEPARQLRARIERACSMRELWHLRVPSYGVISQARGEPEAARRLEPMNRHFPTRSPRSGFGRFDA